MKYTNTPLETSSQHKQSAILILRIKSTIFAILKCQEIAHPLSFLALILLLLPAMEDGRAELLMQVHRAVILMKQ